jgi:hypothetical protein
MDRTARSYDAVPVLRVRQMTDRVATMTYDGARPTDPPTIKGLQMQTF